MFVKAFIPLLERIGILWQTSTLTPANEHFISYHILRKLYSNIDVAEKLTRCEADIPSEHQFITPIAAVHSVTRVRGT